MEKLNEKNAELTFKGLPFPEAFVNKLQRRGNGQIPMSMVREAMCIDTTTIVCSSSDEINGREIEEEILQRVHSGEDFEKVKEEVFKQLL